MPKEPTTPVKKFPRSPYTSPTRSSLNVSPRKGAWILKTDAIKKYKLGRTDFDAILPVEVRKNPRGGADIMKYNDCDVQALAQRLRSGEGLPSTSSSSADDTALAKPNGRRIMRTNAMKEYNLKSNQMDRIKPISSTPNVHGSNTRFYNVCDVEALAKQAGTLAKAPTASTSSYNDYDYEYDYNPFDGLSHEEAYFKLMSVMHPDRPSA
ncbi:hypothetical protein Hypma_010571 [Hypsizygus marmoreus]|uniref:Uncharacterized protein n=1 Tax=Hypsizygus marmoreus TaxID=39966 RepID=A0A369JLR3_HYPMA|nr:hypothetical protein Hypma_010571 [Hypsizygus marmoreus]